MKSARLIICVFVILCIASIVTARLRASEGTVRVSIFAKGKRDAGGYLVRALPTLRQVRGLGNFAATPSDSVGGDRGSARHRLSDVDDVEIFFVP